MLAAEGQVVKCPEQMFTVHSGCKNVILVFAIGFLTFTITEMVSVISTQSWRIRATGLAKAATGFRGRSVRISADAGCVLERCGVEPSVVVNDTSGRKFGTNC